MNPADSVDGGLFEYLVPLGALRGDSRADLARKSRLYHLQAGEPLSVIGETAAQALYLVDGELQIETAAGKVKSRLRAGEPEAAHRLPLESPACIAARCVGDCRILAVDASLLDVLLTWNQTSSLVVGELAASSAGSHDWMARLLQTTSFRRVPPAHLQVMFQRLSHFDARPGQIIVRQGEPGEYFYVVAEGRCSVTREQPYRRALRLAELGPGDCFGEEALIADEQRNATVTALTPARLMRLAKDDFQRLLSEPVERRLPMDAAARWVADGRARWLDVRLPSEYRHHRLPGATNLPLYLLRMRLGQIDPDIRWIVYCDTTRRSAVAAFVLAQKGYEAYVLEGGLPPSA